MSSKTAAKTTAKTTAPEQAGQVDIHLSKPIDIDGAKVSVLTMREPTVGDQVAASEQGGSDSAMVEVNLIANLCTVSPADIMGMSLRDYKKVKEAFMGFID